MCISLIIVCFTRIYCRDCTYYESTLTTTTSYSFSYQPGNNKSPPGSPTYEKPSPRRIGPPPKLSSMKGKASAPSGESADSTAGTYGSKDAPLELRDLLVGGEKEDLNDDNQSGQGSKNINLLGKTSAKISQSEHSYYNIPPGRPPRSNQSEHRKPPSKNQSEHSYYNVPSSRPPRIKREDTKDPMVHRHTPPYALDDSLPKYRNYRQISQVLQNDLEEAIMKAQEELCFSKNAMPVLTHMDSVNQRGLGYLACQRSYGGSFHATSTSLPYTPIQSFEYESVPLSPTFTQQGFKPPTPPLPRRYFDIIIPDPPSEPAPSPPILSVRSTSWPSALAGAGVGKKKKLRVRFSEAEIIILPEPDQYEPETSDFDPEQEAQEASDFRAPEDDTSGVARETSYKASITLTLVVLFTVFFFLQDVDGLFSFHVQTYPGSGFVDSI